MNSKPVPGQRLNSGLRAKVLAACKEPGAAIAVAALSHGFSADLARKSLVGLGVKRMGKLAQDRPGPIDIYCPTNLRDFHALLKPHAGPAVGCSGTDLERWREARPTISPQLKVIAIEAAGLFIRLQRHGHS